MLYNQETGILLETQEDTLLFVTGYQRVLRALSPGGKMAEDEVDHSLPFSKRLRMCGITLNSPHVSSWCGA